MESFTNFLERYVQWVAVALGVAFVGYNVYSYIVVTPLSVAIGNGPTAVVAKPGNVDPEIQARIVDPIEKDLNNKLVKKPELASVADEFHSRLTEENMQVAEFTAPLMSPHGVRIGSTKVGTAGAPVITALPILPPAMPSKDSALPHRTVVLTAAGARQDISYWSGYFTIDLAKLTAAGNAAFNKEGVPPGLLRVWYAKVELLREEQQPDKTWSKPTVVKPIDDVPAYPEKSSPQNDFFQYRAWMDVNQVIISHPAFLQTAPDAEIWVAPGAAAPAPQAGQPVIERPFDPSRGDIPKTDEQRRAVQEYKRQQDALRRQAFLSRRNGNNGGGGPVSPGPIPGVPPGMQPGNVPPHGYPQLPPGVTLPPGVGPWAVHPAPAQPPGVQPGVKNGLNPNIATQDPEILVHDTKLEEGKTYRYAVRYSFYNPLFGNAANFATKDVTKEFAIVGPDPADPEVEKQFPGIWTAPIAVEPSTHVFVTNISTFSNQATFDIFTWENGRWHEASTSKLAPGDLVAAGKTATPYTIADVRKDPKSNQPYVYLMDTRGVIQPRDVASDTNSPELTKLKQLAGVAAAAR